LADPFAVEELSAQSTVQALADRVQAWRLDGSAQDSGVGGPEDGVEGGGEVRSAIADQELYVPEPLTEAEGEVAGLLHGPLPSGVRGDAAKVHPASAVLDEHQGIQSPDKHGVHVQEIHCDDPGGLGVQELPQDRVLVPEHQQYSILCQVTAAHQDGQAERPARKQVHDLEQHQPTQPSPRLACWRTRRSSMQSSIRAALGEAGSEFADVVSLPGQKAAVHHEAA
jgi:hypothetical protein